MQSTSPTSTAPTAAGALENPMDEGSTGNPLASSKSLPSPRIAIHSDFDGAPAGEHRPQLAPHISAPAVQQYQSPLRQHRRTPSAHREIKETLNARSEYLSDETDGSSKHQINQYVIGEEIGRGSYGAVHRATDQFGNEYAVKEFSKARLRKRAQSNIMKMPPGGRPGRMGMRGWADHRQRLSNHDAQEAKDALFLIRAEIAIMKKLNHPNLVQLIEVLDDPEEDSLYMVLEMCKKGVVMQVGLEEAATPYPEETCRYWFRDLILAIEYLHGQGVVHRDIKPDNLLLSDDDVLKVVDFGVSEMFEKQAPMLTAKSAGSPAFLPPELCQLKHGDISGTAADIWSMGISLYCLKYGRLPFHKDSVLDMYESIRNDEVELPSDESPEFLDLMRRVLDKNADTRIQMAELRAHPWVTKNGTDELLSTQQNCSDSIEPPNELEVSRAFTRKMSHLLCVMRAISRFKGLISSRRSQPGTPQPNKFPTRQSTLGESDSSQQSETGTFGSGLSETRTVDTEVTIPEQTSAADGDVTPTALNQPKGPKSVAEEAAELIEQRKAFLASAENPASRANIKAVDKGHAQTVGFGPQPPILGIGTGGRDGFSHGQVSSDHADVVSDSPTGIDFNMYDQAFAEEVERIRTSAETKGTSRRTTYLTRLISDKDRYGSDANVIGADLPALASSGINSAARALSHVGITSAHEVSAKDVEDKIDELKAKQEQTAENVKALAGTAKVQGLRMADAVTQAMRQAASGSSEQSGEQ